MKTRIISALVALLIFVPIIMTGGTIYNIAIFIIAILGLKEFLDIKSSKKEIPETIQFVSYMMLSLLVLFNTNIDKSLIWTMKCWKNWIFQKNIIQLNYLKELIIFLIQKKAWLKSVLIVYGTINAYFIKICQITDRFKYYIINIY